MGLGREGRGHLVVGMEVGFRSVDVVRGRAETAGRIRMVEAAAMEDERGSDLSSLLPTPREEEEEGECRVDRNRRLETE